MCENWNRKKENERVFKFKLVKDDIVNNKNFSKRMLAFITTMIKTITKKYALNGIMLKLNVMIETKVKKVSTIKSTKKEVIKGPFIKEKE